MRISPHSHVQSAYEEAQEWWDQVASEPDDDTSYTKPNSEQVEDWYQNGLITGTEGFYLLTDRTV